MNTQTPTTAERRPINLEQVLALLAFALALAVRFLNLGAFPLSDSEAGWALQSLALASSSTSASQLIIGPQPAYIFLTTWLFALFGAPDFLARFLPALAGSLLVLVPFLFRRQLGRPVALIAAFGLALDPGLVTVSRQAGGPMMAVGFGLLALGLWNTRKSLLAGCAGRTGAPQRSGGDPGWVSLCHRLAVLPPDQWEPQSSQNGSRARQ